MKVGGKTTVSCCIAAVLSSTLETCNKIIVILFSGWFFHLRYRITQKFLKLSSAVSYLNNVPHNLAQHHFLPQSHLCRTWRWRVQKLACTVRQNRNLRIKYFWFKYVRPGPWVESTKGEIWPKPKVQKSQPEFFSVRSNSLKFEVRMLKRFISHSWKYFNLLKCQQFICEINQGRSGKIFFDINPGKQNKLWHH